MKLDEIVLRIQRRGTVEAALLLMQHDMAVRIAYHGSPAALKSALWNRAVARKACEGLGIIVAADEMTGNVFYVGLPELDNTLLVQYIKDSIEQNDHASLEGHFEDVSPAGSEDPVWAALRKAGRLRDV